MTPTTTRQAETSRVATFKIDREEYERIERIAARDERSVSAVLRLAVRDYLATADAEAA